MTRISTFSAAALGLLTAVGCTYDDSELREQLADHEQRISAVEEAVLTGSPNPRRRTMFTAS